MGDEHDSWFKPFGFDPAKLAQEVFDKGKAAVEAGVKEVTDDLNKAKEFVEDKIDKGTKAIKGIVSPSAPKPATAGGGAAGGEASSPSSLGGSVGRGGKNNPADVKGIQRALGISDDGKCGPATIKAIEDFQRSIGQARPDGRVDPGGATSRGLAGAQPQGGASAAAPAPAAVNLVAPGSTNAGILETAEAALTAAGELSGVSGAVRKVEAAASGALKTAEQAGSIVADDPFAAVVGVGFGAVQGVAPGGFLLGSPKPESKAFELGRGVGLIGGGIAVAAVGAGAEVVGTGLDITGIGAVVGVPVNVLGAAAIASGVLSAGAGIVTVGGVLATGGGGPQSPKANPEEALKEARQNLNVAFAEEEAARKANLEATQKFVRFANEPNPDPVVLKQLEGEADRAGQAGVEALKKLQAAEQAELDAIIRANQARGRGGFPPPR